jgi:hypothetical protein
MSVLLLNTHRRTFRCLGHGYLVYAEVAEVRELAVASSPHRRFAGTVVDDLDVVDHGTGFCQHEEFSDFAIQIREDSLS